MGGGGGGGGEAVPYKVIGCSSETKHKMLHNPFCGMVLISEYRYIKITILETIHCILESTYDFLTLKALIFDAVFF